MKKIDIESIFLSSLGSVEKLKWYLRENLNVINYIPSIWLDLTIAAIPKFKRKEILKDFNSGRILFLLKQNRPDLYKIINTERGLIWIENQIENFRKRFL